MPSSNSSGSHFGAPGVVHARRAAGEDDALRRQLAHALGGDVVPHDLAVDVLLAHAAGDELGVLRAEIEHQHALPRRRLRGSAELAEAVVMNLASGCWENR